MNKDRRIAAICLHCKLPYAYNRTRERGRFCSNVCQRAFDSEQQYQRWLAGDKTAIKTPAVVRKCVIRRDGYRCSVAGCGLTNWRNVGLTLQLEHKNGDGDDHSSSNVCLMCPNCHTQTETFGIKNRGRGRHARRERYRLGLSS